MMVVAVCRWRWWAKKLFFPFWQCQTSKHISMEYEFCRIRIFSLLFSGKLVNSTTVSVSNVLVNGILLQNSKSFVVKRSLHSSWGMNFPQSSSEANLFPPFQKESIFLHAEEMRAMNAVLKTFPCKMRFYIHIDVCGHQLIPFENT